MTTTEEVLERNERTRRLASALMFTGRLRESLHDLSVAAVWLDDEELSAAVAAIRKPVIDAGNRLAALRHHH